MTVEKVKRKTATLHFDWFYGGGVKHVAVYYRNECLQILPDMKSAQEWAKKNGFTHARYSGVFTGKDQPKAGAL